MSSQPMNEVIPRRPRGGSAATAPRLRAVEPPPRAAGRPGASRARTAPAVGPRPAPPPGAAEMAGAALVLAAPFLLWAYFLAATAGAGQ